LKKKVSTSQEEFENII